MSRKSLQWIDSFIVSQICGQGWCLTRAYLHIFKIQDNVWMICNLVWFQCRSFIYLTKRLELMVICAGGPGLSITYTLDWILLALVLQVVRWAAYPINVQCGSSSHPVSAVCLQFNSQGYINRDECINFNWLQYTPPNCPPFEQPAGLTICLTTPNARHFCMVFIHRWLPTTSKWRGGTK